MQLFQGLRSISRKLTTVTMLVSSCALLFACGSCLVYELLTYHNRSSNHLAEMADVLAVGAGQAIAEGDRTQVERALSTLSHNQMILTVAIYDVQGRLFAGYSRHPEHHIAAQLDYDTDNTRLFGGALTTVRPITCSGRRIGSVQMKADMLEQRQRLRRYSFTVLLVLLASVLAAYLLSLRLHLMISAPILHLAQVARVVSTDKNYSIRARTCGRDEIGLLTNGFNQMLTQIQRRDEALKRALNECRQLESIINRSHAIAFRWSGADGWSVEYVSDNISQLGYNSDDFISGRVSYSSFVHPEDLERLRKEVLQSVADNADEYVQRYRVLTKSGETRWMADRTWVLRREDGSVIHYQGLVLDITETRQAEEEIRKAREELETRVAERTAALAKANSALQDEISERRRTEVELLTIRESLQRQATHDALTGLPNRLLFSDRLNQQLAQAHRSQRRLAVMFVDLDRFKDINDTFGHQSGDVLLKQVADRLAGCVREVDTLARMGGDEFTIVVGDMASEDDARVVAERVVDALSRPFLLNGSEVSAPASVGISLYPNHGEDVETLVRKADKAMYQAKQQTNIRYQVYADDFDDTKASRRRLGSDIRKALEGQEFVLHYQPRVDIHSGHVNGAEALLRWRHPKLGMLYPDKFIRLAETSQLMAPVDDWAIQHACRQNRIWQESGLHPLEVAVNVSPSRMRQNDLVDAIGAALRTSGMDPRYLSLEFPANALIQDLDDMAQVLRRIKDLGLRVTIDDFTGTEASLQTLASLPVDSIKIDRGCVNEIIRNADAAASAGSLVKAAHELHMLVVAEGVETLAQLELLRSLGCDEMQGYFVSKPVPADDFSRIIALATHPYWNSALPAA